MSIENKTHFDYEQSAGRGYENKLGGLHADPERMQKILDPIETYINSTKSNKISIADLGGGTGNLLEFIKKQIKEKKPEIEITAVDLDINFKQLMAVNKDNVAPVQADLENLPLHNVDIEISRNVYHYLSTRQAEKVTKEAYSALKPGGIFINAFVSSSAESQEYINKFWTNFATEANVKKETTERHFATEEEMENIFRQAGFANVHFEPGFINQVIIKGKNGLAGKYPSLTPEELDQFEKSLLSMPEETKKEFKISPIDIQDGDDTISTVSLSQPVYIIYGQKPNN